MKTENKLTLLFFFGVLMCLMLAVKFTPTKSESNETEFIERLNDTTLINHSEIQVMELAESWMYQHEIEPKHLNND